MRHFKGLQFTLFHTELNIEDKSSNATISTSDNRVDTSQNRLSTSDKRLNIYGPNNSNRYVSFLGVSDAYSLSYDACDDDKKLSTAYDDDNNEPDNNQLNATTTTYTSSKTNHNIETTTNNNTTTINIDISNHRKIITVCMPSLAAFYYLVQIATSSKDLLTPSNVVNMKYLKYRLIQQNQDGTVEYKSSNNNNNSDDTLSAVKNKNNDDNNNFGSIKTKQSKSNFDIHKNHLLRNFATTNTMITTTAVAPNIDSTKTTAAKTTIITSTVINNSIITNNHSSFNNNNYNNTNATNIFMTPYHIVDYITNDDIRIQSIDLATTSYGFMFSTIRTAPINSISQVFVYILHHPIIDIIQQSMLLSYVDNGTITTLSSFYSQHRYQQNKPKTDSNNSNNNKKNFNNDNNYNNNSSSNNSKNIPSISSIHQSVNKILAKDNDNFVPLFVSEQNPNVRHPIKKDFKCKAYYVLIGSSHFKLIDNGTNISSSSSSSSSSRSSFTSNGNTIDANQSDKINIKNIITNINSKNITNYSYKNHHHDNESNKTTLKYNYCNRICSKSILMTKVCIYF